jgi:hypothetical protein
LGLPIGSQWTTLPFHRLSRGCHRRSGSVRHSAARIAESVAQIVSHHGVALAKS